MAKTINVVDCPKCKVVLGEGDCEFKQLDYPNYEIKCKKCGGVSKVSHAAFRQIGAAREMKNPFIPLHIPVPRD